MWKNIMKRTVCSCDKKVGFAVLNKDLYLSLSIDHLNSNKEKYNEQKLSFWHHL